MKEIKFTEDETDFLVSMLKSCPPNKTIVDKSKMIRKLENSKKKIKVSSAKGKGRNLQYWVCEQIANKFGVEFKQSDDDCLVHSREMGQHGTDIVLRGEIKKKFPFSIECKAQESISLGSWIEQAKTNQADGTDWLLVMKKHNLGKPIVCMDFETFMKYYKN